MFVPFTRCLWIWFVCLDYLMISNTWKSAWIVKNFTYISRIIFSIENVLGTIFHYFTVPHKIIKCFFLVWLLFKVCFSIVICSQYGRNFKMLCSIYSIIQCGQKGAGIFSNIRIICETLTIFFNCEKYFKTDT